MGFDRRDRRDRGPGYRWHVDGVRQGKSNPFSLLVGIPLTNQHHSPSCGNLVIYPASHWIVNQCIIRKKGKKEKKEKEKEKDGQFKDAWAPLYGYASLFDHFLQQQEQQEQQEKQQEQQQGEGGKKEKKEKE